MIPIYLAVFGSALLLVLGVLAVLVYNYRRQQKAESLDAAFENTAKEFGLDITKKEELGRRMIGLDSTGKKLLYMEQDGYRYIGYCVDLDDVRTIMVKKEYAPLRKSGVDVNVYVESISLRLNYFNGTQPLLLPFYEERIDSVFELSKRAKLAGEFQALISRQLLPDQVARARQAKKRLSQMRILEEQLIL